MAAYPNLAASSLEVCSGLLSRSWLLGPLGACLVAAGANTALTSSSYAATACIDRQQFNFTSLPQARNFFQRTTDARGNEAYLYTGGAFVLAPDFNAPNPALASVSQLIPSSGNNVIIVTTATSKGQSANASSALASSVPGLATGGAISTSLASASVGPPSLTSVEISNDHAEELLRQRRLAAQQVPAESNQGSPAPAGQTPGAVQGPSRQTAPQQRPAAAPVPRSVNDTTAGARVPNESGDPIAPNKGAWAQAYVDYERHRNLSPGSVDNPTRTQRTFGQIAGLDVTYTRREGRGVETLQLGLLGGHNSARSDFSDTANVRDASQTEEGGFLGTYATYQVERFALEVIGKADFFQHTQRAIVLTTETVEVAPSTRIDPVTCPEGQILLLDRESDKTVTVQIPGSSTQRQIDRLKAGEVSEHNYTLAGNLSYRFDLTDRAWFEPTFGARFTYTDFGADAWSLDLQDGRVLRAQAGARIGSSWQLGDLRVFSASLLGLAYSDVWVDGFTLVNSGFTSTVSNVDEGKLRGLAQLSLRLENGRGTSYGAEIAARGGEDLWGVGGRIGVRYEW